MNCIVKMCLEFHTIVNFDISVCVLPSTLLVLFSVVSACGFVSQCDELVNRLKYNQILWEQDMVKSLGEFEDGCIWMHCGVWAVL